MDIYFNCSYDNSPVRISNRKAFRNTFNQYSPRVQHGFIRENINAFYSEMF